MAFGAVLGVVLLAALAPFVYDRYQVLSLNYYNAAGRAPEITNIGSYEIKFSDKIRSCEDVILVGSREVAVVACDAGREVWNTVMGIFVDAPPDPNAEFYLYKYKDASLPDSEALQKLEIAGFGPGELRTLGLAFDEETSTLFVSNHCREGPRVELFKVDFDASTATHIRSIEHPLIRGPNSIAIINSNEFYVTNDHHFVLRHWPRLSVLETYFAAPLGAVVHVKFDDSNIDAAVVARVPFANGIEIFNQTTVAVASTNKAAVYFYNVVRETTAAHPKFEYCSKLRVPFLADNLSRSSDGALLITGHPHSPSLIKFAATRRICNRPEELAKADATMQEYCKTGSAGSWVSEWTEAGGLKHLYSGTEFPSSATAIRDGNVGIITGLYAKGLLIWRD